MTIQHLRSSTANKRPTAAAMSDGQLAVNTNATNPGLFFKDAGGDIRKIGPIFIGTSAPNSSPATGGSTGHSAGEAWLDTSGSVYALKIYDGSAWRSASGTVVDSSGNVTVESTAADSSAGPEFSLYRNSASPADGDYLGQIRFDGENSTGGKQLYAKITGKTSDVTNGTEDGLIETAVVKAGSQTIVSRQTGTDLKLINGTGLQVDGDVGIGTTSPGRILHIESAGSAEIKLTDSTNIGRDMYIKNNDGAFEFRSRDRNTNGTFVFLGYGGEADSEYARIDSSGRLLLGTTTEGETSADDLTIASTGTTGVTIRSGTASRGNIYFSDGTSGNDEFRGYIQYDHSNNYLRLATNAAERLRIDSSGNVGIGTSSPGQKLDVAGSINLTGNQVFSTTTSPFIVANAASSVLRFGTVGTERLRIDSSGRVGIGTTSPAHLIDARGGRALFTGNSETYSVGVRNRESLAPNGNFYIGATNASTPDMVFSNNAGQEKVRFTNAGNVGIGTTSPDRLLSVSNTSGDGTLARFIGPTNNLFIDNDRSGIIDIFSTGTGDSLAFGTQDTERLRIDSSGNVGIGTASPATVLNTFGTSSQEIRMSTNTAGDARLGFDLQGAYYNWIESLRTGGAMRFAVGNTERLRIDSSGRLLVGATSDITGNTGAKLQVSNAAGAICVLNRNDSTVSTGNLIGDIKWFSNAGSVNEEVARIRVEADGAQGSGDKPGRIVLATTADGASSPTERMRIDSSGNVGIGSSNPLANLDVLVNSASDSEVRVRNNVDGLRLMMQADGTSLIRSVFNRGIVFGSGTSNSDATFAERLRIDSSGRLGVGTSSPYSITGANTLSVHNSSGSSEINFLSSTTGFGALYFGDATSGAGRYAGYLEYKHGDDYMRFATGATERLRIDSSGRVGIGTTSPGKKLQVDSADFDTALFKRTNSTGSATIFLSNTSNHGAAIQSSGNGAGGLALFTQTSNALSERLRIDSSGNVGIGTTSPGSKLHATGEIRFGSNTTYYGSIDHDAASTGANIYNSVDSGGHIFKRNNTIEQMRIDASGRLLVGTTTAGNAEADDLTIAGSGNTGITIRSGNANAAAIYFADGTSGTQNYQGIIQYEHNSDSLKFYANYAGSSSARMAIDSSGRVGIGNTAPAYKLSVLTTGTTDTSLHLATTGGASDNGDATNSIRFTGGNNTRWANAKYEAFAHIFHGNAVEQMRIDSSGRLLVGTSSARTELEGAEIQLEGIGSGAARYSAVSNNSTNANGPGFYFARSRGTANGSETIVQSGDVLGSVFFQGADGTDLNSRAAEIKAEVDGTPGTNDMPGRIVLATTADGASSPTERMRIKNNGAIQIYADSTSDPQYTISHSTSAGTSSRFVSCRYSATAVGTGTESFRIFTNGNVQNTNNSYAAISDAKLKENIVDASSQWNDIKDLRVRNYNFTEGQTHTQIGVVAQEVETVSPGLVTESSDTDDEGNDLGTTTKSVNYSVLYMKAVKALQEAMDRIETLEAKVAALEAG